jgi:DNA mismatch endonuclease, patch repair protein
MFLAWLSKACNATKRQRGILAAEIAQNIARDQLVSRTLRSHGWHVLRIWDHELTRKNEIRLLRRIERALK